MVEFAALLKERPVAMGREGVTVTITVRYLQLSSEPPKCRYLIFCTAVLSSIQMFLARHYVGPMEKLQTSTPSVAVGSTFGSHI